MLRTINERLRVDNKVVLERNNKKISKIFFALRTEIVKDGKSAFERLKNHKPNTPKSTMVNNFISDQDPNLQIEESDFSPDVDSTVLIQEKIRGSKLERIFAKTKARIMSESKHTITVMPDKGNPEILSKRDMRYKRHKVTKRAKPPSEEDLPHCSKVAIGTRMLEGKRTLRQASSSSEEEEEVEKELQKQTISARKRNQ